MIETRITLIGRMKRIKKVEYRYFVQECDANEVEKRFIAGYINIDYLFWNLISNKEHGTSNHERSSLLEY